MNTVRRQRNLKLAMSPSPTPSLSFCPPISIFVDPGLRHTMPKDAVHRDEDQQDESDNDDGHTMNRRREQPPTSRHIRSAAVDFSKSFVKEVERAISREEAGSSYLSQRRFDSHIYPGGRPSSCHARNTAPSNSRQNQICSVHRRVKGHRRGLGYRREG